MFDPARALSAQSAERKALLAAADVAADEDKENMISPLEGLRGVEQDILKDIDGFE